MLDDFKQAFNRYNNAHVQIIIINVVIFLALAVLKVFSFIFQAEGFFLLLHHNIAIPASFSDFLSRPWTMVTFTFFHDLSEIFPTLSNCWALYRFGRFFFQYLAAANFIGVSEHRLIVGALMFLP